ncbi:hypothetical protein F5Y18DRAFT_426491 [Xylariaceae sp. FL1019]|nr:hypothetical protein F5Y18DRAFT_426491 [Xylariaceae sp. FL1019]
MPTTNEDSKTRNGLYTYLDPRKNQIRLLEFKSATSQDHFPECSLITVSLNDHPWFAALSYVWGDASIKKPVRINGQQIDISISLYSAITHLMEDSLFCRLQSTPCLPSDNMMIWSTAYGIPSEARHKHNPSPQQMYVWADGICINQENATERRQQVDLMSHIYGEASFVFSWLGATGYDDYDMALEVIEAMSVVLKANPKEHFRPITKRFKAPEFQREHPAFGRLQERLYTVPKGEHWIAQPDMERSRQVRECRLLETHLDRTGAGEIALEVEYPVYMRRQGRFPPQIEYFFCFIRAMQWRCASVKPDAMSATVWEKVMCEQDQPNGLSMPAFIHLAWLRGEDPAFIKTIMMAASHCSATDPRDMVLGLCSMFQFGAHFTRILYTSSVRQVYLMIICMALLGGKRDGSFAMVFENSGIGIGLPNDHDLPSWMPDLSRVSQAKTLVRAPPPRRGESKGEEIEVTTGQLGPERVKFHCTSNVPIYSMYDTYSNYERTFMLDEMQPEPLDPPEVCFESGVLSIMGGYLEERVCQIHLLDFNTENLKKVQQTIFELTVIIHDFYRDCKGTTDIPRIHGPIPTLGESIRATTDRVSGAGYSLNCLTHLLLGRTDFDPCMPEMYSALMRTAIMEHLNEFPVEIIDAAGKATYTHNKWIDSDYCKVNTSWWVGYNGGKDFRFVSSLREAPIIRRNFVNLLRKSDGLTLFFTSRGGLGLGPNGVKEGDNVWAIDGCPYPMLLREVNGVQKHVGQCYLMVHDLEGPCKLQKVEIH